MLHRLALAALLTGALGASPGPAQPTLVPSTAAPYRQKLDLAVADARFLLVAEPRIAASEGPHALRFAHPGLDSLVAAPGTVRYVTFEEGAFHVQILHLRAPAAPPGALGPQAFEILNGAGEVAGRGQLLVVGPAPEPADATDADGNRTLEVGRPANIRLRVRTNGNYAGRPRPVSATDYEWSPIEDSGPDSLGMVTLSARVRPVGREPGPPRVTVETADGRTVELAFRGLEVRRPLPRPARVSGGPIFLDGLGTGTARIVVHDLPRGAATAAAPEVVAEGAGSGELVVREQRHDRETGELAVTLEFVGRGPRPAGSRELREFTVRTASQDWRARVEVVAAPTVALVRTEPGDRGRAVLLAGAAPTTLRVAGGNLDDLRVDCTPLGPGTTCQTVVASPTELVARIAPGPEAREAEYVLPLVATTGRRRGAAVALPEGGVRVLVERPAVPIPLVTPGLLSVDCGGAGGCRPARDGASLVVRADAVPRLTLAVADSLVPAAHGWQRVVVTVTRVRGDQRQVVRTHGTSAAPRMLRNGLAVPALPLVDATTEVRHGDVLVVRVEHALEQYGPAYRTMAAAGESLVRSLFVDAGGRARFAADVSVQPVLYSFSPGASEVEPLYMNAGIGVTWQPMTWRMQPRLASLKLQLIGTSLTDTDGARKARQPALFLSGNLRVPGTDPARQIVLTSGVARLLTGDTGWRLLAGAGVDLGLSRIAFGR